MEDLTPATHRVLDRSAAMAARASTRQPDMPTLVRSPLRYPGGKSRAVPTILEILPQDIDRLASPFFGGGSIELAVASICGAQVFGYDAFKPLVDFWNYALTQPESLAEEVAQHHPLSRAKFYDLQEMLRNSKQNAKQTAALFYVLNRSSFSGTTLSGGMSPGHQRFTESAIERLRTFKVSGVSVEHADFADSLSHHTDDFLYLDPPYANGGALYGEKGDCHIGFDHAKLASILTKRDRWILSYNDCQEVRDLYPGFHFIVAEWAYGMNTDKRSNEVLILSKDLKYPD